MARLTVLKVQQFMLLHFITRFPSRRAARFSLSCTACLLRRFVYCVPRHSMLAVLREEAFQAKKKKRNCYATFYHVHGKIPHKLTKNYLPTVLGWKKSQVYTHGVFLQGLLHVFCTISTVGHYRRWLPEIFHNIAVRLKSGF